MDTVAELCSQCGGLSMDGHFRGKRGVHRNPQYKMVRRHEHGPKSVNKEHGRYNTHYKLVRQWDLDGLTRGQQDAIDTGLRAYLWTPIPLGLKMATRLKKFLEILREDGKATPDPVVGWKVLIPTAGAGGSTIALATAFSSVTAGDFSERQLVALRHNLHDVMGYHRVKIDAKPVNLLDREDINEFDALVLEPCWGGTKYKTVKAGELDLYVQSGRFDEKTMDLVSKGGPGKDFVISEGVVPLASVVTRLMYSHPRLRAICILTPYNFNKTTFEKTLERHSLMYLNIKTHGSPPADLTEHDMEDFIRRRQGGNMVDIKDMIALPHYKSYTGPDRYMIIFRKRTFIQAIGKEEGLIDHAVQPALQRAMIQTPFLGAKSKRKGQQNTGRWGMKNNHSYQDMQDVSRCA